MHGNLLAPGIDVPFHFLSLLVDLHRHLPAQHTTAQVVVHARGGHRLVEGRALHFSFGSLDAVAFPIIALREGSDGIEGLCAARIISW